MNASFLRRLEALEARHLLQTTIVCLLDGSEYTMNLFDAMKRNAAFVRTLDGSHDFDELYKAVLPGTEEDFSSILEAE